MTETIDGLLLLPRIRVENANCISGPLTWGFPPPSAFVGFVHAMHRLLGTSIIPVEDLDSDAPIALNGVGIVCHHFEPQVSRGGYRYRFNLTKNPTESRKKIMKDGSLGGASFVEEGRAHIELSLLVGVRGGLDPEDGQKLATRVAHAAQAGRLAGGSVVPSVAKGSSSAQYVELSGYESLEREEFRTLRRRLLPGFALVDRNDLLAEHHAELCATEPDVTLLDALLDVCALHHTPVADGADAGDAVTWRTHRKRGGWLVPVPVGFGAISPLYSPGEVASSRDPACPFSFVESLYSLGEWRSPHRIESARDLMWYYENQTEEGLYLVQQPRDTAPSAP